MKNDLFDRAKKLLIVSVLVGLLSGLAIDLFIRLIRFAETFIWSTIFPTAHSQPLYFIVVSAVAGLLMGLCVKYFGTNPGIGFEAVLASSAKDGALGLKQIKRVVINSFVGIISGASIGPENPITVMGGSVGYFIAKWLKMTKEQVMGMIMVAVGGSLGILMGSPIAGPVLISEKRPADDDKANILLIFSSMVAASFGFGIYLLLGAPFLSQDKLVPAYAGFQFIHLFYGLVIGLVGTGIGLLVKYFINTSGYLFKRVFKKKHILKGAVVGLLIGLCGAFLPLVRFDGSAQLIQIVNNPAYYGLTMILIFAIVRLIATSVALGGGYQGGNIFPTIFISGAIGIVINILFPFIPLPVAMIACMVPAMYVFIPLPLFTIFLFTEISSFALIPVMALSLTSGYLVDLALARGVTKD